MATIYQLGQLNTTALVRPDLYVQVVPPQIYLINGVPTNLGGIVGTAIWGPVGVPVLVSGYTDYARLFGALQNRSYDMGTFVARAQQEGGAGAYACVRVTDGTDVAASAALTIATIAAITYTSRHTGTGGNQIKVAIDTGSAPGTFKATVSLPFYGAEVFDNIAGTGNAFWVALAAAINGGNGPTTPASKIITAAAGASTAAPAPGSSVTLASGTDGAATITGAVLVGSDAVPRKGMYALRSSGVSVAALCDLTDTTTFATQISFGLGEGIYMVQALAPGGTVAAAVTARNTGGFDSYAAKILVGDWERWFDPVSGVSRFISPQAAAVGKLCNLSPHMSTLNKPLSGTVGTQRSESGAPYSNAELDSAAQNGLDLITNPIPYGNVFGFRLGRNTSSNAVIHGDNYTRMTNYLAQTLAAGMGKYVGELQSRRADDSTRGRVRTTLNAFLQALRDPTFVGGNGMIDDFLVICDKSNNPDTRIALGYLVADVKVVYLAVIEYFIVNLEGGQSVRIERSTQAPPSFALAA